MRIEAGIFYRRAEFVSQLSRVECEVRLRAAFGPAFSDLGRPITGEVIGSHVYARVHIRTRNAWQTVFSGRLTDGESGARLTGSLHIDRVGLGVAVIFALVCVAALFVPIGMESGGYFTGYGALAFFVFAAFMFLSGRYMARNEAAELTRFFAATLDAELES